MRNIAFIVLLLGVGLAAWIRLAPSDAARWHVDPAAAPQPGTSGWKLGPAPSDGPAPVYSGSPDEVLLALAGIAADMPRTRVLAGSPEEGRMTFVSRSRLMGFPDYTSVAARPTDTGTALDIVARQRFGQADMGVNRARVEDWVGRLDAQLDRAAGT